MESLYPYSSSIIEFISVKESNQHNSIFNLEHHFSYTNQGIESQNIFIEYMYKVNGIDKDNFEILRWPYVTFKDP